MNIVDRYKQMHDDEELTRRIEITIEHTRLTDELEETDRAIKECFDIITSSNEKKHSRVFKFYAVSAFVSLFNVVLSLFLKNYFTSTLCLIASASFVYGLYYMSEMQRKNDLKILKKNSHKLDELINKKRSLTHSIKKLNYKENKICDYITQLNLQKK